MAKYIMDVSFDIPQEVLGAIPQNDLSTVKSGLALDRLDKAKGPNDLSSVRLALEGSDSWCQKQARKLTITIGTQLYKARGFEIVHCQS